jgi:hypothetical protein
MKALQKYLWLSQVSLFGGLLICCLILPHVATTGGGVSNFGNHKSTIVLYTLSFSLSALFLCMAARLLLRKSPSLRRMAGLLLLLALLNVLVLVSTFPRNINATYFDLHNDLAIILFVYEFALSVWFVLRRTSSRAVSIFLIEFIGSMIGLLTILKFFHLLFIGQAIGGLGFGLLLVTCLPGMVASVLANPEKL